MDQCPNCGSSVREWKDTCDECGTSLQGDTGGGWGSGSGSERQPRKQQQSGGQSNRSWGGQQGGGQQRDQPQRGRGESGGPQRGRRDSGRGRGRGQDDGIDRRTLLAGGGVAAAALAGGWFVFLRDDGAPGGTEGDDTAPATTSGSVSPGQSQSEAPTITSGRYGPFTLEEDDGEHYFAVDLDAGDRVEVLMEFSHDQGDLDISLLGPDNFNAARSTSTTDDETVSTTAETSGEHYIRSYVFFGAPNSYELDVRIN